MVLDRLARSRGQALFENDVREANAHLLDRLDVYKAALRGDASLFGAASAIPPDQFAAFIRRQNVAALYPGILGVGWATPARDVDTAYLAPRSLSSLPALAPRLRQVRAEAMATSRDRAGAQITGKVEIRPAGSAGSRPGFLLYLPVYSGGWFPPATARQRQNLVGFVYAPVSAAEFFGNVYAGNAYLRVRVYDGRGTDPGALYFASRPGESAPARYRRIDTIFVTGHAWTESIESTPAFEAQLASLAMPFTIVAGLLATALLFALARRLNHAAHAAEAANRAKSAFLATMSHELRTPLNAIVGYADLLDMGVPEPVGMKARAQVARIQVGARQLLELIDAVLQLARTEARIEPVKVQEVELGAFLRAVAADAAPLAAAKGLRLELPAGATEASIVRTDPAKLRQICRSLLENAAKFTQSGKIRIEVLPRAQDVLIHVTDSGIGIASEHRDQVFTAFWQADRGHTRTAGGAGLGLALSRNLARLLGGDLTCESTPGEGSTFTLRLPRQRAAETEGDV